MSPSRAELTGKVQKTIGQVEKVFER